MNGRGVILKYKSDKTFDKSDSVKTFENDLYWLKPLVNRVMHYPMLSVSGTWLPVRTFDHSTNALYLYFQYTAHQYLLEPAA